MSYRYRDDLSVADVAFEAEGTSLEELFTSAWDATLQVMIENPSALGSKSRRSIAIENQSVDLLLYNFLQELIYYKDAEALLLRLEHCRIDAGTSPAKLEALAAGEPIDSKRHHLGVDVKAVTFYRFCLKHEGELWRTTVVLDV
jgi:SHS2 domain-containing protein